MFDSGAANEGLGRSEQAFEEQATGNSPDGLGAYVRPEAGDNFSPQQPFQQQFQQQPVMQMPSPQYYPQQMAGELAFLEPEDTSDGAAMRSGGFTLLFVAVSTGIGYAWKGGFGAISGLLLSAGAANGYRAQKWFGSEDPSEKHEALVSSVFAAGEILGGLFVGYQAIQQSQKRRD